MTAMKLKLCFGNSSPKPTTLESHASGLQAHQTALLRHEHDLSTVLPSLKHHADCIGVIRGDLERLAPLVNAQSELLRALQNAMLKIVDHLGWDPPELPPAAVNRDAHLHRVGFDCTMGVALKPRGAAARLALHCT